MADALQLQASYQSSMLILENIARAHAELEPYLAGCLDSNGILKHPDKCSEAMTNAIRTLLDAQSRLAKTDWPVDKRQAA